MADASDKRSSRRMLNTSQTTTLTDLLSSNSRHGSGYSRDSSSILFQSKMFQSASAALDAYISDYDKSSTSSVGSYLQQSSSSTLSPFPQKLTVTSTARKEHDQHRERNLSSKALIDASYEEMRRADSERERARALIETSKVLHDESSGQLSPLPGSSIVAGHLPSDIDSLATDALILAPSHVTSKHWTPHSSLDRYPTRLNTSASLDDITKPHGVTFASSGSRNGSYVPKPGRHASGYSSEDTDLYLQSGRSGGSGRYRQSHSAEETELLSSRSAPEDFSNQRFRRRSGSLPLDRPRYPSWLKDLDVSGVSSVTRKSSETEEPSYRQVHRLHSGAVPSGKPRYPSWLKDLNVSGISSVTRATSEADDAYRYAAAQRPSSASVALDRPKGKYPSWLKELDVSGISSVTNTVRSDLTDLPLNPGISNEESRSYLRHYPSVDALLTGEMDRRPHALSRTDLGDDSLSTPKSKSRNTGKLLSTVEKNGIKKELSRLKRLKSDMVASNSREVNRKGDKDFRFYKEDRRLGDSHHSNGWDNGLASSEGTWNSVKPVTSDSEVFKKPLFNGNSRGSDTRKALGKRISPKRLTRPMSYKFRSGKDKAVSFKQEHSKPSKHVSRSSNRQKGKYIYWSDGSDSGSTNDLLLQWPRGSSRASPSRDEAFSLDTDGLLAQPPVPLLNLSPSTSSNHSETASRKNSTTSSRSTDSKVKALLSKAERVLNKPLPKPKLRPVKIGGGSPDTEEILSEERPWERHTNFRKPQPINKQNDTRDRRIGGIKRTGIIGDFLHDVMDEDRSESKEETLTGGEQPGPVEALKNMLFSMQSVQASTARLANGVGSDDSEDEQTYLGEDTDIPSPVGGSPEQFRTSTEPGAQSLDRALHHLSRLKLLVTTDEEGRGNS
ncbi:C18orf54 [Branchiostoma lanceolatum]|uniref:C18orf54 protein n=1 Tax=Branchiostoma lanceolatum TaxID=7740 RepID=A0A8K0EHI8_BRALA|nr:C18orf54 [Branchiostoma lanceolatum]